VAHLRSFRAFMIAVATLYGVVAMAAPAQPLQPSDIEVVNGNTIRVRSATVSIVGYDVPATGRRALCSRERELGERAAARLRALVAGGKSSLQTTSCACRQGTEGTLLCNRGRACGILVIDGLQAGEVLIKEGLAKPFICGERRCPRRKIGRWCER
jgi:endonuclease YncB( thermonuclease family)